MERHQGMYRHEQDSDPAESHRHPHGSSSLPATDVAERRPGPLVMPGRATLMALQRSAGNRAVAMTLQRHAAGSGGVVVQREESVPDWEHGLLTDLHQGGRVLGPAVRSSAAQMPKKAAGYTAAKTDLDNMLQFLQMHEDRTAGPSMGDNAVAAVAATGSVAKKLPGKSKEALKAKINAYNSKKPELRSAIKLIQAQQAEVRSAAQTLTGEGQKQQLLIKSREKSKAEEDLAAVQQKRKDAIDKMTTFLDFAGMLADPGKGWKSALDKATGMIGGTLKDLVFADTMGSEVAAAKEKVAALSATVLGLQDSIAISAIQAAASKLEAEQTRLEGMLEGLVSTVDQAEVAEQDLHQVMTTMGSKGEAAAAALDEGSVVLDMGNDATRKLPSVRSLLDSTDDAARMWSDQAGQYLAALEQGVPGLDANQRAWARDAVIAHRRQAEQWKTWVKDEASKLATSESYLGKGSFRERYTKGVEDALKGVRSKLS